MSKIKLYFWYYYSLCLNKIKNLDDRKTINIAVSNVCKIKPGNFDAYLNNDETILYIPLELHEIYDELNGYENDAVSFISSLMWVTHYSNELNWRHEEFIKATEKIEILLAKYYPIILQLKIKQFVRSYGANSKH